MPANVGSQTVSVAYKAFVDSIVVNRARLGIIPTGIYSGGLVTATTGNNTVTVSPMVCEIGDGTSQVRVVTTTNVNVTLSEASPYLVCRWTATGIENDDYMEIIASSLGNLEANDLIIGSAPYSGGVLQAFTYSSSAGIYRSIPRSQDAWFKASLTSTANKIFVQGGWLMGGIEPVFVSPIELTITTTGPHKIYANSDGTISTTATYTNPPILLAQVTKSAGVDLTFADIVDCRSFIAPILQVDGTSIKYNTTGKLSTAALPVYFRQGTFTANGSSYQIKLGFQPQLFVGFNSSSEQAQLIWLFGLGNYYKTFNGNRRDIAANREISEINVSNGVITMPWYSSGSSYNNLNSGTFNVVWFAIGSTSVATPGYTEFSEGFI